VPVQEVQRDKLSCRHNLLNHFAPLLNACVGLLLVYALFLSSMFTGNQNTITGNQKTRGW
jgi:hypothetical protein